jgi:hypothetical protein
VSAIYLVPFADFSQEAIRATPSRQLLPLVMRTKHSDQSQAQYLVVSAWLRLDKELGLGIRGLSSYHSQVESSVSATTALGRYHAEEASVVRS